MFMIEKSLIIVITMYGLGFMLLVAQYAYADVFGLTLTSYNGTPIKSNVLQYLNLNGNSQNPGVNAISVNITSNTRTNSVNNPIGVAASMAWELMLLLTGTYIFNILFLLLGGTSTNLGPALILAGPITIYVILLARAIIGYLRGI